jgi:hypothetical protein
MQNFLTKLVPVSKPRLYIAETAECAAMQAVSDYEARGFTPTLDGPHVDVHVAETAKGLTRDSAVYRVQRLPNGLKAAEQISPSTYKYLVAEVHRRKEQLGEILRFAQEIDDLNALVAGLPEEAEALAPSYIARREDLESRLTLREHDVKLVPSDSPIRVTFPERGVHGTRLLVMGRTYEFAAKPLPVDAPSLPPDALREGRWVLRDA